MSVFCELHVHECIFSTAEISSEKHKFPIYTLQTLTKRTYVVTSPDLVIAVQKESRTLSFNPYKWTLIPRMFEITKRDLNIATLNMDGKQGNWGYQRETHNGVHYAWQDVNLN